MLKVSTKSTYAIRALIHLGRSDKDQPVRISDIADKQAIPLPYLEQIFSKLRRAGLIAAVRGPQGGYKLAKDPGDISLSDIISVLEGPIEPILCTMPENRSPHCHEKDGCVNRCVCNELDGELKKILSRNTLGTLCAEPVIARSEATKQSQGLVSLEIASTKRRSRNDKRSLIKNGK